MSRERVEKRRLHQQMVAREKLQGLADAYAATGMQAIEEAAQRGLKVQGISTLDPGDVLTANRAGSDGDDYLGQSRGAGIELSHTK
jgi:hypothetical protein